jgi:hypothetical protein
MVEAYKHGKLTCGLESVTRQRPRRCQEKSRKGRKEGKKAFFVRIELAAHLKGMLTQVNEARTLRFNRWEYEYSETDMGYMAHLTVDMDEWHRVAGN